MTLYPLKFLPLYKNVIWGGNRIKDLGFDYSPLPNCGELWAMSSVEGRESVVANGFLADNTLNEAIEVYTADLVGERVYRHFGTQYPLLIKIIDAAQDLSVQVHPDDALAQRRGMPCGKTEMWYVMEADSGARLVSGFSRDTTPEEYQAALRDNRLPDLLHSEAPSAGDVYFIPAGRVHALGKGLMVAEVQQTSDCTYRLYDYGRLDTNGRPRQLHTREALDALDFHGTLQARTPYQARRNEASDLVSCDYFTTRLIDFDAPMRRRLDDLDTAMVYLCVEGIAGIKAMGTLVPMHAGECVMVPAAASEAELFCQGPAKLLEIHFNPDTLEEEEPEPDWVAQFVGQLRDAQQ